MKSKIMSILIMMLLISTTALPIVRTIENAQNENKLLCCKLIEAESAKNEQIDTLGIMITKPEEALYVNDEKLFPLFFTTVIFGPITIEAEVTGGTAEKVEFYIDDELKNTDYTEPYTWFWDETALFKHEIKVIAYGAEYAEYTSPEVTDQKGVIIFNFQSSPPIQLSIEEVIDILMNQIIIPSSSDNRISAFLLSEPLRKGDIVTSESGENYNIDDNTWFIFIDDDPGSFFAHDVRYVFLDDNDRSFNILDEAWPPNINDVSLFDPGNISRGDLIEIYSVIDIPVNVSGSGSIAPSGDYGDAPDGQDAYHGVTGRFPTLYSTSNSLFGRPGGHTVNVGEEMLGITVSAEVDAIDPSDPDDVPNLVDSDMDERSFIILTGGRASISVTVTVKSTAPDVSRYINILVDLDQSGHWSDGSNGKEWIIVNKEVHVPPGKTETITFHGVKWGVSSVLMSPVWTRVALTREKIDESIFSNVGGWDGSGQFQYGEIEDQFVFLMDDPPIVGPSWPPWPGNPPGGKDPNPGQPPGPQPPGPSKGPCGTDVNYHVIIINCGDCAKHMRQGIRPGEEAAEKVGDLANDQGYNQVANLGPGKGGSSENTLENIGNAIDALAGAVKCGDHVLIYIVGHGKSPQKGGGILLMGSNGRQKDVMKPGDLANMLGKIPACPDEDCDTLGKCCHVTIVIESCHAGNFNVDGVTGPGRTVMGSCQADETAAAANGGSFTNGFVGASRDPDADSDGDGDVEPGEAYEGGEDSVDDHNRKTGHRQNPWKDSQECECKCPCEPSIVVDKRVWDPFGQEWIDEIEAPLNQVVTFGVLLMNDGECRNVTDLEIIDVLPECLEYANNARLYLNGVPMGSRPPDSQTPVSGGLSLTWDLNEIESISPGDEIHLLFEAETVLEGPNENWAEGSAHCSYDPSVVVTDADTATVYVTGEEDTTPPVTEKTIGEPNDEGGYIIWSHTPITFEATDDMSGVNNINYEIWWDSNDDMVVDTQMASEKIYSNSVTFTVGEHDIYYGLIELRWFAVDNAGNPEDMHYQEHYVMEG